MLGAARTMLGVTEPVLGVAGTVLGFAGIVQDVAGMVLGVVRTTLGVARTMLGVAGTVLGLAGMVLGVAEPRMTWIPRMIHRRGRRERGDGLLEAGVADPAVLIKPNENPWKARPRADALRYG